MQLSLRKLCCIQDLMSAGQLFITVEKIDLSDLDETFSYVSSEQQLYSSCLLMIITALRLILVEHPARLEQ